MVWGSTNPVWVPDEAIIDIERSEGRLNYRSVRPTRWKTDCRIFCRKELQDLDDMLAKLKAVRYALLQGRRSWVGSITQEEEQWIKFASRKAFRQKLFEEQVCGAAIPTAYANSNAL